MDDAAAERWSAAVECGEYTAGPIELGPAAADLERSRLFYLVLYCADLDVSRRFYTALGLDLVQEQHESGPVHYAALLNRGTVLELYPAGDRPVTRTRLGLTVTDLAAAVDALKAAGFEVRAQLRRAVATDPDGSAVELFEVRRQAEAL